jgi:hypothetical protein
VAIVATLVVLVVAGFAIAIIELSRDANRSRATQTTTVAIPAATAATAPAATAPAAAPKRRSH